MRRPPTAYIISLAVLLVIATLVTLTFVGVPPFDNLQVFILTSVVGFFTILVLGVIGGAFVGMILAQRILGNREFTPFERQVLLGLEDVRARLEALEKQAGVEPRQRR